MGVREWWPHRGGATHRPGNHHRHRHRNVHREPPTPHHERAASNGRVRESSVSWALTAVQPTCGGICFCTATNVKPIYAGKSPDRLVAQAVCVACDSNPPSPSPQQPSSQQPYQQPSSQQNYQQPSSQQSYQQPLSQQSYQQPSSQQPFQPPLQLSSTRT